MSLCYSSDSKKQDEETYCNLYSKQRCENQFAQFSLASSFIFKNEKKVFEICQFSLHEPRKKNLQFSVFSYHYYISSYENLIGQFLKV